MFIQAVLTYGGSYNVWQRTVPIRIVPAMLETRYYLLVTWTQCVACVKGGRLTHGGESENIRPDMKISMTFPHHILLARKLGVLVFLAATPVGSLWLYKSLGC